MFIVIQISRREQNYQHDKVTCVGQSATLALATIVKDEAVAKRARLLVLWRKGQEALREVRDRMQKWLTINPAPYLESIDSTEDAVEFTEWQDQYRQQSAYEVSRCGSPEAVEARRKLGDRFGTDHWFNIIEVPDAVQ